MTQINQERLTEDLAGIAAGHGCELDYLEFAGGVLRVVLDRPEGVTIDHCSTVAREVSALLDAIDYGPSHYTLEVTSPGLDRKLFRPRDYERFVGSPIKVTYRDETGAKRTICGRLEAFSPDQGGQAAILERDRQELLTVRLDQVQVARLQVDF